MHRKILAIGLLFFSVQAFAQRSKPVTGAPEQTEKIPEYPGGQVAMDRFLGNNLKYPDKDFKRKREGVVIATMVIMTDGSIDSLRVTQPLSPACDKEVIRVLKLMPRWTPGKHDGKIAPVRISIPVGFVLKK